ncbi:diaminobutyrate--2-oxoglutarate transaminase [Bradyrhizobium sp. WSM2793]|uniref:diaminobutyrate--2-oxoglutarate transaminase n=1 Tax=Bradyrhizobium sp. WSM2793 TaxID=1038866 RepID=UPI0035275C55
MSEPCNMQAFEVLESNVRADTRSCRAIFSRARGSIMLTEDGRKVIDFFSGAGALNYGQNNHAIKAAISEYLAADAVVHGPDIATPAKLKFMGTFNSVILQERGLQYHFQFSGPTGANAIEAAIELSRKVTGRQNIISFTHGYHGLSLGAIAANGSRLYRAVSGSGLSGTSVMPYDGYLGPAVDTADYVRKVLMDESSGIDLPAAILVEAVQGEGGINVASKEWLQSIQAIARDIGALLIVDDIEVGCGRTGEFFSFEFAGLSPDIIVLAKSLSGYGLPLSMLLIKEGLDACLGENASMVQGGDLAFVSATAAIDLYWRCRTFSQCISHMGEVVRRRLEAIASQHGNGIFAVRGRGMTLGFDCQVPEISEATTRKAFEKGLIVERCEPAGQVVKFLPALTIDLETLNQGLAIFEEALVETLKQTKVGAT